jgi:hypothetical protein
VRERGTECLVPCTAVTGSQKRPGHSHSPDQFGGPTEGLFVDTRNMVWVMIEGRLRLGGRVDEETLR